MENNFICSTFIYHHQISLEMQNIPWESNYIMIDVTIMGVIHQNHITCVGWKTFAWIEKLVIIDIKHGKQHKQEKCHHVWCLLIYRHPKCHQLQHPYLNNIHNNTILRTRFQHNDKFSTMLFLIFKTKVSPPYVTVDCQFTCT